MEKFIETIKEMKYENIQAVALFYNENTTDAQMRIYNSFTTGVKVIISKTGQQGVITHVSDLAYRLVWVQIDGENETNPFVIEMLIKV